MANMRSLLCSLARLAATTVVLVSVSPHQAIADVIVVGYDMVITRIADAARIARDGDTVLIMPGTYRGDVAVWTQQRLDISGIGEAPVLIADGKSAEDKAIWVFGNGRFTVDNIEFHGARVPDHNGAGIRFEGSHLTVRNSVFRDN